MSVRPPRGHGGSAAAGDALAAEILAELEPFRFREVADDAERAACMRLRYRAVLEFDLADRRVLATDEERDEFDADAVHIVGLDDARVAATCRLVLPAPGRVLPTARAFDLHLHDAAGVAEWGRVVVDPDYRGDGHSMFMGLAAQGWLSMRARGFDAALAATPARLIRLFEALGFVVTVLGPPRTYWGEERYPILCAAAPSIERVAPRWSAGHAPVPDASAARLHPDRDA